MAKWDTVAIVGVGLIGGSIGLALRRRGLARQVVGIGRRESSLRNARRCQTVDRATTKLERGVAEAELIVVCTPVARIVEHVRQTAEACPDGAVITDAGSTKRGLVEAIGVDLGREVTFVGSHPIAGSEKTGPAHAQEDLFAGRPAVVTPTRKSLPTAVDAVRRFWASLGCDPVVTLSPAQHDAAVAAVSHLPHVVAAALAATTTAKELPLASSGWGDTTRIAGGDVELWRQILTENREQVLRSLDRYCATLKQYREALAANDSDRLVQLLTTGKQRRDALGS